MWCVSLRLNVDPIKPKTTGEKREQTEWHSVAMFGRLAEISAQYLRKGSQFNTDSCCNVRKVEPLERALAPFDGWITGRKRFHGAARSALGFVSAQAGKLKIEPLAAFSALDLSNYVQAHHLPSHPLKSSGYHSIGCVPCTAAGGTEDDPRAGRWQGSDKTECGIHFAANGQIIRTVARGPCAVL